MKYVRKLLPVEPYEIAALESWFSDLSADGLHLYSTNTFFATFHVEEEKRMLYRMEPMPEFLGVPTETEQLRKDKASHKEKGWDYVGEMGRYFYIYRAEEGTAPYFETPEEESQLYERYAKKKSFWNSPIFMVLVVIILLALSIAKEVYFLQNKTPYDLVHSSELPFDNLPFFLLTIFPGKRLLGMQRIQRSLAEGEPHPTEGDWYSPHLRWKHRFHYVGCLLLVLALFLPFAPYMVGYSEKPIEEVTYPLPMVALADIENDPDFHYVDSYLQDSSWERKTNMVYRNWSVGAPVQYSYNQAGRVDGFYKRVLWVDYKEFSFLVTPQEYIESYLEQSWVMKGKTYTVLTDTPFDYALLIEGGNHTELYLADGNRLLELDYSFGDADLTAHYDLYKKALEP